MPTTSFRGHLGATATMPGSGGLLLLSLVTDWDTGGFYSGATFSPTIAGYYNVSAQARFYAATDDELRIYIYKNNLSYSFGEEQTQSAPASTTVSSVNDVIYFDGVTDKVDFRVWSSNLGSPKVLTPDTFATVTQVGNDGAQGLQGVQGAMGLQGVQGAFQGAQGVQGLQGVQGFQGYVGDDGNTGDQGPQGISGTNGNQGSQGSQGIAGSQGSQGNQGAMGLQGVQGAFQGAQGVQGFAGTNGAQGLLGPQGSQGIQGAQGLQGFQGSRGQKGFQGLVGFQGFQGDQGLQGVQGTFQGAQGPQGYGPIISSGIGATQQLNVSAGATARQYIVNSGISGAAGWGATGTIIEWDIDMSKTAAGASARTFDICVGTAGTTADTPVHSFTTSAGSEAADTAWVHIRLIIQGATHSQASFSMIHLYSGGGYLYAPTSVLSSPTSVNSPSYTGTMTNIGICITAGKNESNLINGVVTKTYLGAT